MYVLAFFFWIFMMIVYVYLSYLYFQDPSVNFDSI